MKNVVILFISIFSFAQAWSQTVTITKTSGSCSTDNFSYRADLSGFSQSASFTYTWEIVGENCSACFSPVSFIFNVPVGSHQSGMVVKCTVTPSVGSGPVSDTETLTYTTSLTPLGVGITIDPFLYPPIYCSDEVVFKATSNSSLATFSWYKNGNAIASGLTYNPSGSLYNGDVIRVVASTSEACFSPTTAESQFVVSPNNFFKIDQPVGTLTIHEQGYAAERCQGGGTSIFYAIAENAKNFVWEITPAAGTLATQGTNNSSAIVTWNANYNGTAQIKATALGCVDQKVYTLSFPVHALPVASNTTLQFCEFEPIELSLPTSTDIVKHRWYSENGQFLGERTVVQPARKSGIYAFYSEAVNHQGCISASRASVAVEVTTDCDSLLNRIETITYDNLRIVSHTKSYFDLSGKSLQTQTKSLTRNEVLATQAIGDEYERSVITTLAAPLQQSIFQYKHNFATNTNGEKYSYSDFGQPLDTTTPGTVGWYYSVNNTMEENVPVTGYPYNQIEHYNDGTGEVKRSAGPGEVHRLGMGREALSGTFPVFNELNDYVTKRASVLGLSGLATTLTYNGLQNVARDQNGNYVISITDKEGKTLMSARRDTTDNAPLSVSNTISGDAVHPLLYFYLLNKQSVSFDATGLYSIEDIVEDKRYTSIDSVPKQSGKWLPGFYRIVVKTGTVTLTYVNHFTDVSYQFYDDAGRLKYSVSPNGFNQWKAANWVFNKDNLDVTTYRYNHRGWLLDIQEPDAGKTRYVYRKDGKIRFSQNAEQKSHNRFSYTNYDLLGRPVESGEYTGSLVAFIPMDSTAFPLSVMKGELEKLYTQIDWSGSRKDWVKTYYDYPDTKFYDSTHLPADYKQEFSRGAVSKTENANIKTWYSYDELGRVTWMAQKPTLLDRVFVVKYKYDFLGNVLTTASLAYNTSGSQLTEFYHHYAYDEDMRLDSAFTSLTENGKRKLRARYEYYLHGPLKRIELGDQLQGIDFIYNIHGWLTQINHPDNTQDPGNDGAAGSSFNKDVFGMLLNYYESEFTDLFKVSSLTPGKYIFSNPSSPSIPSSIAELIQPAMITSKDVIAQAVQYTPGDYSAAKPLFRELLNHYMADNGISLKGYQADAIGSQEYEVSIEPNTAIASIDESTANIPLLLSGTGKRFLIDLGDPATPTNLTGWNNMTSGLTGAISPYLLDVTGDTSSIRFEITKNASNGWGNGNYYNSEGYDTIVGDYPASACRDSYFASGAGGIYKLKGLDPTKYYTLKIFGSRLSSTVSNRIGAYTINSTQRTLSAANNKSVFVYFHNLQPSGSGEITLDFGVASGSQLGYINVLEIVQKDAPGIVGPGRSLSSQVVSRKGVLTWTDNASNETGYRIERRKSGEAAFLALADAAANATTYTDETIAVGFMYEYRISAFNSSEESTYSNIVTAEVPGVADKRFLVDFGNPAFQTTGWNNMPSGLTGSVLVDLVSTQGTASTIDIEVLQDASATFAGDGVYYNTIGYNGIVGDYPVRACQDSYFSFGAGGSYKLKGLDPNKLYTITIFGSRTGVTKDDRRGAFIINGIRKVLDAGNNTSRTITFYHMIPDSNGEITIQFGVDTNAFLGYMNVWDILEVTNPIVETPSALQATNVINGVSLSWTDLAINESGYRIERRLAAETNYTQIAEVGAGTTQYVDNTIMTGTQYYYRVAAAYGTVNSAYSNISTITTSGNPPDRRYRIDFGSPSYLTTDPGWNNFTSSAAGYTLQNLVDANGNGSALSVQMVTVTSNGYGPEAYNTDGPNSALLGYPATACRDSYYAFGAGGTFKLKGLNINRFYSITIFGSRSATDGYSRTGTYTINGKQYTLDAKNNTGLTITLYNIVPNEAREIELSFNPLTSSGFGYINVMDFTETAAPVVVGPSGLTASVDGRFGNLSWLDNSTNEAGFKIERRATGEQVFTVVATVGPNVTQYSDGLLASGTTFEYRVAAYVSPEVLSTYTNMGTISIPGIPSRRFLMDFGDPAITANATTAAGWNNMTAGTTGAVLNNMIDSKGAASTIGFEVVKDASNGYGTPYNSYGSLSALGDYPLTATKDSYYAYGSGGTYKLKGLNQSYYYTLTVFGSRQAAGGDATKVGSYIINGEKKTLNCANNTTNTITFKQIQPNKVGEIIFEFGVEAGSQFGYFGVLDFTEYSIPDLNPPALLSTQKLAGSSGVQLTWSDNTTYESGYEIYRATSTATSLYTLITTTAANATTYTDATASPSSVYYYRVRATSSKGVSPYSNTLISDNAIDPPVLQTITSQTVNTGGTKEIILQATPGAGVAADRKTIVVLGSSTAEGWGSTPNSAPYPNSWASLLKNWLTSNYTTGWEVINLALAGYNSNELLADTQRNMDKALTYNPVLIIINLPSNDVVENVPDATFLANLTAMKQQAEAAGAKVLITTTQPRGDIDLTKRTRLQTLATAIVSTFGSSAVEVYSTLAHTDLTIKSTYNSGDQIHVNNAGHSVIFQAIKTKAEFLLNKTVLDFTTTNAPSFVKITPKGNGQASLEIKPTGGQTGNYANITISVADKNGNYGNRTFDITVDEVDAVPGSNYKVKALYNGLITSTAWRTTTPGEKGTALTLETPNAFKGMYLYEYDDKYQFLNANWAEPNFTADTFAISGQRYRVTGMAYDPNGNIQSLHRYDGNGIHTNIFNYDYDYNHGKNNNQLKSVSGYVNAYTYNKIGQMVGEDKVEGDDKYVEYDVSGKVVKVFSDVGKTKLKIQNLYDDRGFRLAKRNYAWKNETNVLKRTTWYIRDASGNVLSIYEENDSTGQLTETEVPIYGSGKLGTYYPQQDGSTAYEITDHLGNVRALVRENVNVYTATMEDNGQVAVTNPRVQELAYFKNITETAQGNVSQWLNHTEPSVEVPEPDYVSFLDGNTGRIVGPAITLRVNAGDTLDMKVFAKYEENSSYNSTTTLASIIGALSGTYSLTSGLETMTEATQVFTDGFAAIGAYGGSETNRPRAFLNFILFDQQFEYDSSGFDRISTDAGFETNQEFTVDFDSLEHHVIARKAGYIYIYVSNETPGVKVWFDDLTVKHKQNIVTQATDFGVWGDILREQKIDESKYRFGYQGQFAEKDDETGWNHFELREYDPIVGKWMMVDPAGQYPSPYVAFGNNPINRVDPDGGFDGDPENPFCSGPLPFVPKPAPYSTVKFGKRWTMLEGGDWAEVLDEQIIVRGSANSLPIPLPVVHSIPSLSALGTLLTWGSVIFASSELLRGDQSEKTVTLYRGVHVGHPDYVNALRGMAIPAGGDATAEQHVGGNFESIFTSWSLSKSVANYHANKHGPGGVVLEKKFKWNRIVPSPTDAFAELEMLVPGVVKGAKVGPPTGPGTPTAY